LFELKNQSEPVNNITEFV